MKTRFEILKWSFGWL